MYLKSSNPGSTHSPLQWLPALALSACLLVVAGCGSTKVINSQKTLAYHGSVYNVTNVMVYSWRAEGVVSGDETIDLAGVEKRAIQDLLKQHKSIFVRQLLTLDEQEVIYQAKQVDSWSDYNKMQKKFASATRELQKFLGDPGKSQLELK